MEQKWLKMHTVQLLGRVWLVTYEWLGINHWPNQNWYKGSVTWDLPATCGSHYFRFALQYAKYFSLTSALPTTEGQKMFWPLDSTLFLSLKKTYLMLQHHGSLGQFIRNVLVSVAERMPSRAFFGGIGGKKNILRFSDL